MTQIIVTGELTQAAEARHRGTDTAVVVFALDAIEAVLWVGEGPASHQAAHRLAARFPTRSHVCIAASGLMPRLDHGSRAVLLTGVSSVDLVG